MKMSRFTASQVIAVLKQDENRRVKKMYADAQLSAELLKEAMAKNGEAISAP